MIMLQENEFWALLISNQVENVHMFSSANNSVLSLLE